MCWNTPGLSQRTSPESLSPEAGVIMDEPGRSDSEKRGPPPSRITNSSRTFQIRPSSEIAPRTP